MGICMYICVMKPYGKTYIVELDCGKLANATLREQIRLSTIDVNSHMVSMIFPGSYNQVYS